MKNLFLTLSLSASLITCSYADAGFMDTIRSMFSAKEDITTENEHENDTDENDKINGDMYEGVKKTEDHAVNIPTNSAQTTAPTSESLPTNPYPNTVARPAVHPEKECDVTQGFAAIAEGALPAVVNVATTQVMEKDESAESQQMPGGMPGGSQFEELFRKFLEQNTRPRKVQSLGSGFIIKVSQTHFYVATNYHVVQDAKTIKLLMNDKTEVVGTVHASDERTDIAVIKASLDDLPQGKQTPPVLEWGDTEKTRVGDWAIAIGNPFGFGSSVTIGIISSMGRDILARSSGGRANDYVDEYLQHSAQINFGNSGGCLLNTRGKVVGINTAIISPTGGNVGIGFAIPAALAKKTIDQLIEFGRTKRGWLGVKIQPFTEDMAESVGLKSKQSAIVADVVKDGPADKAGIEKDDIIVEFNGMRLDEGTRLTRLVGDAEIGKKTTIKVWRKGTEVSLPVVLGEYEEADEKGLLDDKHLDGKNIKKEQISEILGITIAVRSDISKEQSVRGGVIVLKVDPISTASELGLQQGDIILEANQKEINKPKDLQAIVNNAKKHKRKNILLLVMRQGEPRYAPLKIEADEENPTQKKLAEENLTKKKADDSVTTEQG
jgi:serine protease Do